MWCAKQKSIPKWIEMKCATVCLFFSTELRSTLPLLILFRNKWIIAICSRSQRVQESDYNDFYGYFFLFSLSTFVNCTWNPQCTLNSGINSNDILGIKEDTNDRGQCCFGGLNSMFPIYARFATSNLAKIDTFKMNSAFTDHFHFVIGGFWLNQNSTHKSVKIRKRELFHAAVLWQTLFHFDYFHAEVHSSVFSARMTRKLSCNIERKTVCW